MLTGNSMNTQQAAQKEALMEAGRGSSADQGCSRCSVVLSVLLAVMGLAILALVAWFILYASVFTPACGQEASTRNNTGKINLSSKLTKPINGTEGRYDIFTVNKSASYLIYGWVQLKELTGEEVVLMQILGEQNRTIQKRNVDEVEIFFHKRVLMAEGVRISIYFDSAYKDSLFHMYEL
ncbi:Hypothetical protein SMAX5B_017684 [Xyrichtys novacula]|uniref:TNF family profile domain-containing protein n=1 Tax=Xyrichtys novacula TaxID=13765 RepID=A0AAV1FFU7_XYRNO|nr:Hypothetical protein SMAX5B_017684 [Xyrichtys novacula]